MSIVEFLLARIGEDEAVAERGGWHNGRGTFANDNYGCLLIQPSRVLAECAAKRAIITHAVSIHDTITGEWGGGQTVEEDGWSEDNLGTDVVRALAAIYADHPDYEPDWA